MTTGTSGNRRTAERGEEDAESFVLLSIDPAATPHGGDGDDWYCYRIAQGSNRIVGYRRGSLRIIKQDVQSIVMNLNERRHGKRKRPVQMPGAKKTG